MILLDFPLYLMETLKCRGSLCGFVVVFMFLTTVSKGSACHAPSTPQCFETKADEFYICEWSMNTTESDVMFDLYFKKNRFRNIKTTWSKIHRDKLNLFTPVDLWVEAHVGNSSCTSTKKSVILSNTVKYEAPQKMSVSWLKSGLKLQWKAVEQNSALAEVRFRRHDEHRTELWENRTTNTTVESSMYHVIVPNLSKHSAYQVQIRHRSTKAHNPLWSNWSPVVMVPAELEQMPGVTVTTTLINGTRKVMLAWKPMPHAVSVTGVNYTMNNTQSSRGCPCAERTQHFKWNKYTTYISYSAANISVIARNTAGYSPLAIIQVPAVPAADLKSCDKTLLDRKLNKQTCLELYDLQDGDSRSENVITLTGRKKKKERVKIRKTVKDYVRYLYFEHRCNGRKPQTVKMCLFYQKEGVPLREPQDFTPSSETDHSVDLSWKAIPSVDQRGFLTHYSLCRVKISSQEEHKDCQNISASLINHRLENLTPGTKYNISLAGVTRVGEGPRVTITINTQPKKPVNVLWSLLFLFGFFFISTVCTFILKRIKNKIFPPVPTPVIPDFTPCQPESQMLERKEEVHELTLHQLHPERKSLPEDAEETPVFRGKWDDGTDEDAEDERGDSRMPGGSSDECLSTDQALRSSREGEMTDMDQVDNEIAMLIYRNGLVFDVKTDST
ncbi:leukemia inhibitory factor receptor isoform X12 [Dicentrarchus labrax]|uniref:leukemia inhibitory factor receptor isoform X12 n=1 Tax=Dicentrarchus labrax TaxID=13489 RepID=UPI0021F64565|nr:leukemia inhibitory factor receptor isoform X12 [Dicentrarchus labrax]